MSDQKVTDLTADLAPTLDDLVYTVNDPSGTPGDRKVAFSAMATFIGFPCSGRLTLTSGVPITTSDVIGASTIYFTPFNGNVVALYTSGNWKLYTFTERSLALSALTSGKNYDVFLYDNAGTLTLELSAAWTNDTTRADAIAQQDGVDVKSSDHTRRYLGTLRTTGTTTTEDSGGGTTTQVGGKRFLWNKYNQVPRSLNVIDTTDSWSYVTNTWRQADGAAGNKVEYVVGTSTPQVTARVLAGISLASNTSRAANSGVGLDSTTAPTGLAGVGYTNLAGGGFTNMVAEYSGQPGLGYHYLAWLEKGPDGTGSFRGDDGGAGTQSGLTAMVFPDGGFPVGSAIPVATDPSMVNGRLTLTSGTPITTSDVTGATTIYFTPYNGNRIALYDGTRWSALTFAETSLPLGTLTSGKNYDVFGAISGGVLALSMSTAWTSDTARNDALGTQDGVDVLGSDHTKRYLGTFRTTATTTTEDSGGGVTTQVGGKRFLWNRYNQVQRVLSVIDTTDNWAYTTDTIRQANAAAGNKVEYVSGDAALIVQASLVVNCSTNSTSARAAKAGVGLDSTTTFSGLVGEASNSNAAGVISQISSAYDGSPGLGYHYFSWNEKGSDGTCTFRGDNGADSSQSGLRARVWN